MAAQPPVTGFSRKEIFNIMRKLIYTAMATAMTLSAVGQQMRQETYCNPLDVDYTYMIYNSSNDISYRSGADPAVVEFRGEYYMFVTRSHGYWHSTDLQNWEFIKPGRNWYPQGCNAPAAHNYKDSVLYVCGDPSGSMSVLYTDDPKSGDWEATPAILHDLQDPDLFIDDDGKAYMFWGSSNVYPIRGRRLDKNHRFIPEGPVEELFNLDPARHGWERFGENHTDTILGGYIEGPWLTKHNGRYYMQYAAPGTEFNVYADGVYVADSPMGPYRYQAHNPISYKPGGYINGAGHGSTVEGPGGQFWHFGSMALPINVNWERRLCMFPTYFDADGIMHCDTRFGDYPRYAPATPGKKGEFRGWMLLSYNRPVTASSSAEGHEATGITDENSKTFWLAGANNADQWAQIDLGAPATVHAIQVNYNDYKSDMYGRYDGLRHRYTINGSLDGREWFPLVDRSKSYKDAPHDYVELETPRRARYIRYDNIEVPTPSLSLSAIRVFGLGEGKAPAMVKGFEAHRHADRRDITLTWQPVKGAQGYNILWGIAPDKLYSSWMVYGNDCRHLMKCLTTDQKYYFAIEAFNENGVSRLTPVTEVQ